MIIEHTCMWAFAPDFRKISRGLSAWLTIWLAYPAFAADFQPMSEIEMRLVTGLTDVPVPFTYSPMSLSYVAAYQTTDANGCDVEDIDVRCQKELFVIVGTEDSTDGYGFYTRPGFGWRVDRVENWPIGSGQNDFPEGKLITLSEEMRELGGRDPLTKAWPRREARIASNSLTRILANEFNADVTPLTDWEEKLLGWTVRRFPSQAAEPWRLKIYNPTPWRIEVYLAGTDECSTETGDSCKEYTAYALVSDNKGKRFGFHAPISFTWDIVDIRAYTPHGAPVCAYMTFTEEIRSPSVKRTNGEAWPKRKHSVCASPNGFVEAK